MRTKTFRQPASGGKGRAYTAAPQDTFQREE
jgi:hypothetical protein